MTKRKPSSVSQSQPSLKAVPPDLKSARKSAPAAPLDAAADSRPANPFIVDNSEAEWNVARYLRDWCDIARAFDIATGYFEIGSLLTLDGQWQKLEQVRILMGDEVSLRTKQAFDSALVHIAEILDRSLEEAKEDNDFLKGVPAVVSALQRGQIACRVYTERKFHAKAYITHAKFPVMPPVALVGSSNFTYPGLHANVELNIQVRAEVDTLQAWYEKHWEAATDVTPELLGVIERHIREYSPFEVYVKALSEFFKGHELTETEWECSASRIYPLLAEYQREGYHALLKIAERYNGALLCDGVGLGKTFIGLMLIERLVERERKRVALLVPKAARVPVWESKLRRYLPGLVGIYSNLAIYNHTDLLRGGDYVARMQEIADKADVLVIDEAHHFRNQAADRYKKLFGMIEGKHVYLLTATPINNSLLDLQHLIELFSHKVNDYFKAAPLGIHSLPGHFRKLETALEELLGAVDGHGPGDKPEISLAEAEQVLAKDPLTQALVVQRSRAYARQSQERRGATAVVFPHRLPPQVGKYSLKKTYGRLLDHLQQAFFRPGKPPLLSLAVYYPLNYTKRPEGSIDDFTRGRQAQVVSLIRTQLLKRFESSARAFEATCERLLLKLMAFVQVNAVTAADRRRLERWQGQNDEVLARLHAHQRTDEDEEDEEDVLPAELLEAAEVLSPHEYRVDEIVDETYLDLDQLTTFLDDLKDFAPETDDKLQTLLQLVTGHELASKQKVLIFSEYLETADYLYRQLKAAGVGPLDVVHSSIGRDRGEIITAFSPYYNDSSSPALAAAGVTETRVLISTDVLAEGLNLQDAALLVNYDLHWNPVRLMQRIGRVDRRLDPAVEAQLVTDNPDGKALRGKVHFWNFLPPNELNPLLSLYRTVAHKTLRISKVFGIEGKQLLTAEDDYGALREFNQVYEGNPSSLERMRLSYRDLLDRHPGLEERVAGFPLRVFSGRTHPTADVQAVFFCYTLPAKNPGTGEWHDEAGFAQWYLYDLASGKVLEDAETINRVIAAEADTPRRTVLPAETLAEIRKKVEQHIKQSYLRSVVAPVGVRPVLKAWMELN